MMVDLLVVSDFKPGDDVIKEGSEGDSMYIVAGGARVLLSAGDGGCYFQFWFKILHISISSKFPFLPPFSW